MAGPGVEATETIARARALVEEQKRAQAERARSARTRNSAYGLLDLGDWTESYTHASQTQRGGRPRNSQTRPLLDPGEEV